MPGYKGKVTLCHPDGHEVEVEVPGREIGWGTPAPAAGRLSLVGYGVESIALDTQFRRLLSAGYRVMTAQSASSTAPEGEEKEEEKKETREVAEANEAGGQKHGGDHASQEVKDSPNRAKRGCRGGRGSKKNRGGGKAQEQKLQAPRPQGGTGIYSPQPLQVSKKMAQSAEKSAELLAELLGRAAEKTYQGVDVRVFDLLVALETGDNPLPAFEAPRERHRARILVTADRSGSTQAWSGLGQAWAMHIAKQPDVDVVCIHNFNGTLVVDGVTDLRNHTQDDKVRHLLGAFDLVVYLGDGDGRVLCEKYAQDGATVIGLDCFAANVAKPRLATDVTMTSGGRFTWVDRVSAKDPDTWQKALQLVLRH